MKRGKWLFYPTSRTMKGRMVSPRIGPRWNGCAGNMMRGGRPQHGTRAAEKRERRVSTHYRRKSARREPVRESATWKPWYGEAGRDRYIGTTGEGAEEATLSTCGEGTAMDEAGDYEFRTHRSGTSYGEASGIGACAIGDGVAADNNVRVEAMARRTSSSVVDRLGPTV